MSDELVAKARWVSTRLGDAGVPACGAARWGDSSAASTISSKEHDASVGIYAYNQAYRQLPICAREIPTDTYHLDNAMLCGSPRQVQLAIRMPELSESGRGLT